ncbi:uncharacterized protein METZ01_LOCUS150188 [marine metagenome]|uniref:Uncharacterized protein n=1 Tax=marine metagenome TaxID=408172 RepID=A0A382A7D1_9ZZZZ
MVPASNVKPVELPRVAHKFLTK